MHEARLAQIDRSAIDRTVEYIIGVHDTHRLTFAYEVGKAILDNIFDGDSDSVRSTGTKNASFNSLTSDPRLKPLNLSKSTLHNFVRVHIQINTNMPELAETLKRLSLSHQVRLLRIDDQVKKLEIAKKAADENWSVTELETQVKATRGRSTRGRPQDDPVFGNIKLLTRAAKHLQSGINDGSPTPDKCAKITAADIDGQRDALAALKRLVAEAEAELERLARQLRETPVD